MCVPLARFMVFVISIAPQSKVAMVKIARPLCLWVYFDADIVGKEITIRGRYKSLKLYEFNGLGLP